ncbi:MAG: GNAT family N-acetyltransferase [Acidobacteria bacterium]|nr:GNAT family N-acetyltransferase [Acidobacteriota bacterium]
MEILDLRLIRNQDLQPLLEEEGIVWRNTLRWDYAATAAMVLRFMEARALTGYAMVEAGRVVGYSFYVLEHNKGLIGDAFVRAEYRNGSNEVRLITHVVETLQATPGIRRIEAQLLNLDAPGLREHFLSQGFQGFDRHFLYLSIPDAIVEAKDGNSEWQMTEWDSHYFQAAAELILAAYRGHVDSAISDQYRTQPGAVRFLENIIRLPGCGTFLPGASFLALCGDGSLRSGLGGIILTSVVSDRVAHITQLCVAPEQRGRGLGRRLIRHVVNVLRASGFQGATLTVTVSNTRAVELYRSLGFTPLTTFPAFAWDAPQRRQRFVHKKVASRS